ncbi:DNA topoisomerase 3 [Paenibacillus turpanensis]|uniref:DNA topoisomerase 3 n=1 Tax=Paenibacillus turpanensis TaxID=2689078 RepID=UPI00140A837F|nr:DNA topoisomerase 3 [Paenibacillus turpanensis]
MKTLIIAEKPDMGRNIAAAIEPKAKNNRSYIEGEQYIITWAIGHLIGLAEPDSYDAKYKKWNINDLPIIPDVFQLVPNPKTKDQLKVIADLAKRCGMLVNACDAGREGQHIFSLIQRHLKLKQPVKRLWISDLTPETIKKGFAELKDGAEYENLTKAARARSEADWLIGMNGSRAFTTKHQVLLSVGRVQTPVLALLYDRQKEIDAFSSSKFYDVEAFFRQKDTEYKGMWQGEKLSDPAKAEALAANVKGKQGEVASYEVKETKEYPFKLYDLTLLQREANAKYGFSAKKTLDVAQALYEKHKVISYPRTTSNYVTEQNIPEMHKALDQLRGTSYRPFVEQAEKRFVHKNNKAVCNPSKVEDHHAILPTHRIAKGLSADEEKIYDLIVRRFLSHFYAAAEYKVHTVMTEVERETFKTTVKELLSLGWKVIYADQKKEKSSSKSRSKSDKEDDDEQKSAEEEVTTPFHLESALGVLCFESTAKEKETQPPKPYTEGTLLKAMESAGKQIEDEELRDAMKDSGLGTPATRAAIIERLKQVGYMQMQGKRLMITQKGRKAIEVIRGAGINLLASPEMTGQWERRLNEIAKGIASDQTFMENVKKFAAMIVGKVKVQPRVSKEDFEGEEPAAKPAAKKRAAGKNGASAAGKAASATMAAAGSDDAAAAPKKRTSRRQAVDNANAETAAALAEPPAAGAAPQRSSAAAAAARTAVSLKAAADGAARGHSSRAAAAPEETVRQFAGLAPCPSPGCGGKIIMGRRGYGCSHYKEGCRFVIWKEQFGTTLDENDIIRLIEVGITEEKLLQDEAGNTASGRLLLQKNGMGTLQAVRSAT